MREEIDISLIAISILLLTGLLLLGVIFYDKLEVVDYFMTFYIFVLIVYTLYVEVYSWVNKKRN